MKKIVSIGIISILTVIISGCGNSDTPTETTDTGTVKVSVFENSDLSIEIPTDWETIKQESFTSNVPQDVVVAFRNNIKNEIFTANVNVNKIEFEKQETADDLAKSTLQNAKDKLIQFQEISKKTISIPKGKDKLDGIILEFEGKRLAIDPLIRFKQLYVVNGSIGYMITAAYLPSEIESVVNSINEMLNSFSLK